MLALALACETPPADSAGEVDTRGADTATELPGPLPMRWIQGDRAETWEQAQSGLYWALSELGARPQAAALTQVVEAEGVVYFTLQPEALGFSDAALEAMSPVFAEFAASAEAAEGVDVGRFLMRSLVEPSRYAAITGACGTLGDWRAAHQRDPLEYAVTTSLLTVGERLIALNEAPEAGPGYLAAEGTGSLLDGTFAPNEYETVHLMANGQPRYAVYNLDGDWIPQAEHSAAGTPGACRWCHEWQLQEGTPENASAPGYLGYTDWMLHLGEARAVMAAQRRDPENAVDYDTYAVHDWGEALVEQFLQPSPERVAVEWGVPLAEVLALSLPTHDFEEYGWIGRYRREDVDAAHPSGTPLPTLRSARQLDPDEALLLEPGFRCD